MAPPQTTAQSPSVSKALSAAVAKSSTVTPARREKNELLESMTKQLQLILSKLNDKSLNDETREKYQTLAQTIQLQMAKITKPKVSAPPKFFQRRRLP